MRLVGMYSKKIYLETETEAQLHRLMNVHFRRVSLSQEGQGRHDYQTLPEPMMIKGGRGQRGRVIVRI